MTKVFGEYSKETPWGRAFAAVRECCSIMDTTPPTLMAALTAKRRYVLEAKPNDKKARKFIELIDRCAVVHDSYEGSRRPDEPDFDAALDELKWFYRHDHKLGLDAHGLVVRPSPEDAKSG